MRYALLGTSAMLIVCSFTVPAHGQNTPGPTTPGYRPTVSPYLNLLRRDQPRSLNYYNLVRPQIDTRAAIGQLQGQVRTNEQAISSLEAETELPTTGHSAGFMTHQRFFLTGGSRGEAGRSRTAPTALSAPPRRNVSRGR
jgi:hypothetical protein